MLLDRVLFNEGLQINVAVERDIEEIRHRFEHEGMSYLTITLPILCDALDQGLAAGRFTRPAGFRASSKRGNLPAIMAGFFKRVFNEDTSLRDDPCIASIRAIRQVTRLFKKVELPCSDDRIAAAYRRYEQNDEDLVNPVNFPATIRRVAGMLWTDLDVLAERLYCSAGIFGAGATAECLRFNERHSIRSWPERAELHFPLAFHGSHREDDTDSFAGVDIHPPEREQPVRVVQVPKTLKTPRTISVEPSYMMLMQQSVAKPLMDYLESDQFGMYSIRFVDQTVNRDLARDGSISGSLSTIDLSDASDLVSQDLVRHLFEGSAPTFLDMIEACRSRIAKLPDGSVRTLNKFASMGSALCFPIEAMVFYTIALSAMVDLSGKRLSKRLIRQLTARVAVYGDDIIVPTETASAVMEYLEACRLRVNHNKSFTQGFFRESCGGDYYRGHDITPVYVRRWDFSGNSKDAKFVAACVSLSNQFYMKGLWHASQYIRSDVERRLRTSFPRTRKPVGGLTFASYLFDTKLRWDRDRCGYAVKTFFVRPKQQDDPVGDVRAGMLAHFSSRHLQRTRSDISRDMAERCSYVDGYRSEVACEVSLHVGSFGPTWEEYYRAKADREHLDRYQGYVPTEELDEVFGKGSRLATTVRPYALDMKRKLVPVQCTGIVF
ncbi:RNA-directed RNA polymerase [ssRNA phage SRR7976325_24]|uniref:RNA-directed RNA polymerase n=1 Tax=ssRNA phage SRR7976325_24 TaxID=2786712 RepID=A0A8S5L5M2_9VIRU|nr:RNA-directed RNA polymerase [ssRNA phage SRR7976325_24]DAD52749.1 TPA_asm: RNA-directed RNA polymerase [ssRNA phage SRR7976325_24]